MPKNPPAPTFHLLAAPGQKGWMERLAKELESLGVPVARWKYENASKDLSSYGETHAPRKEDFCVYIVTAKSEEQALSLLDRFSQNVLTESLFIHRGKGTLEKLQGAAWDGEVLSPAQIARDLVDLADLDRTGLPLGVDVPPADLPELKYRLVLAGRLSPANLRSHDASAVGSAVRRSGGTASEQLAGLRAGQHGKPPPLWLAWAQLASEDEAGQQNQ